jgi:hypothetical protein
MRFGFGLRLQMVSPNPWRFIQLGMSLNLLEIAILPEFGIDLVLLALLPVEGLVELALGLILAYVALIIQGGGISFKFLMC